MTQTLAIFLDAYRELNAKRLFWLVLVVSFLIVAAFGAVGLTAEGFTIFGQLIESPIFNSNLMPPEMFYRLIFVELGVKYWLAWIAAILALVSTAGMIPEFVAGGSVELSLSKPIGRVRLFLTKYAAGLLFAALQVAAFCVGAFIVLRVRGGSWDPSVFAAVPLVVAMFSFVYCVCALFGLLTRSTIASLLLTLLVWLMIFAMNNVHWGVNVWGMTNELRINELEKAISALEARNVSDWQISPRREQLEKARQTEKRITRIRAGTSAVMTILPKTSGTAALMTRVLFTEQEETKAIEDNYQRVDTQDDMELNLGELQRRQIRAEREQSAWWILGTSFGFEAVVLGVACVVFARRDF